MHHKMRVNTASKRVNQSGLQLAQVDRRERGSGKRPNWTGESDQRVVWEGDSRGLSSHQSAFLLSTEESRTADATFASPARWLLVSRPRDQVMTWFNHEEKIKLSLFQRLVIKTLQTGSIPNHVSFIMDGNRRYARSNNYDNVLTGHSHGFDKFTQVLAWCSYIGIKEVSAYCFSIENFNRPKDEVEGLLNLLHAKFCDLVKEEQQLTEKGIKIRVFGAVTMLPEETQKLICQVTKMTENNDTWKLNLYIAYTSTEEMCNAIDALCNVESESPIEVTEGLLQSYFRSCSASTPDLMIRTSGEVRLSNFLTWQSAFTPICFLPEKWPELTIWGLFKAIFFYQRHKCLIPLASNTVGSM